MPAEFRSALYAGMVVCAAMIVFNLIMARRRGPSAIALAAAFGVFGALLYGLAQGMPGPVLYGLGGLLAVLLGLDGWLRLGRARRAGGP